MSFESEILRAIVVVSVVSLCFGYTNMITQFMAEHKGILKIFQKKLLVGSNHG